MSDALMNLVPIPESEPNALASGGTRCGLASEEPEASAYGSVTPSAGQHISRCLIGLFVLLSCGGCATLSIFDGQRDELVKADAEHPVRRIVCLWQPADGQGLDGQPSRGFAGQIIFLTAHSPTPVEVEGDVTIYLFDDQGLPEQRGKPLHVFRFVDGGWQAHLNETAWGPTYRVFIPYVRPGQHAAHCSLAVKFDAEYGQRVSSDLANISLRGPANHGILSRREPAPSVSPAHVSPAAYTEANSHHNPGFPPPAPQRPSTSAARPTAGRDQPHFRSFSIPYTVTSDFR